MTKESSNSSSGCVGCLSFLVGVGALVIMILGAVCLGQDDYTPCGGHRSGALAMVIIGSVFEGMSFIIGVGVCCIACCVGCSLLASETKKTTPIVSV
jgi:hypothetical protein